MSAAAGAYGERPSLSLARLSQVRIRFGWTELAYVAIIAAAIALRFWDLGGQALHHDESIHAQWSWKLTQGDYTHDPIFHGPFYYHVQGLMFLLFGASDYTARLSAALFGTGLVLLPLLLRRRLGSAGTLAAVALIAFSPTIVYYSRFFREDIYYAFFTFAMIATMWRFIEEGRDRWLILFALAFTGSMTTKEATYLSVAVFLVYLDIYTAYELAAQTMRERGYEERWRIWLITPGYAVVAWAAVALWPFLGPIGRYLGWTKLPRPGHVLILLGTLILPLLTAASKSQLDSLGLVDKSRLVCSTAMATNDRVAMAGLFAVTTSAAAFVGLQWRPKLWTIAFGASALIYLTLMTSLWTNLGGLCTGPFGSLDYWMTQQDVARGGQPWFYYDMLMPMYEFLPLAICVGGLWWSVVRGDAFSRFVIVWMAGMWIALSIAGEKMPWLNTHLALPACILAAWTVQRAWKSWTGKPKGGTVAVSLGGAALVSAGAMLFAVYVGSDHGGLLAGLGFLLAGAAVVVFAAWPYGRRAAGIFAIAAVAGGLAFFSLRTMIEVSFGRADDPRDLLIYTQSSPDIPKLRNSIDDLAKATGLGYQLPIAVDTADSYAWPWAWYLRDYKRVGYIDFGATPAIADYQVLLVNKSNVLRTNDALLAAGGGSFGGPIPYPHRWWFDETYKTELPTGPWDLDTWRTIKAGIFGGGWLDTWFHYWRTHDPGRPNGSTDAVAYFPANFDRTTGKLLARPLEAPKPTVDSAGRPAFGGTGLLPGQFISPVDIEHDADGNLYVIDRQTRRLQKFDKDGNFLNSVDIRVNAGDANEAAEPWGLAVGPSGQVVVADTFGWRVRVFDKDLNPVPVIFGHAPDADPTKPKGEYDLYGPRDAAVDASGNIWVTDTGDDRIMVYDSQGIFVRQIGSSGSGPDQFDEPVGLSIGSDGSVYVADMYNRRVVILDKDGKRIGGFPVANWGGQEVTDKPYIRALNDGRIAVSLPSQNEVRIYDRSGNVSGTIRPAEEPLSRPYGIVERGDGRLWIVEGGSGRVRLFPIP